MSIDRRGFFQGVALSAIASAGNPTRAMGQEVAAKPLEAPPEVTRILAHYVATASGRDLPAAVRREGVRTLFNWVGCAVGGSRHPAVEATIAALTDYSGERNASLMGRAERFDAFNAALINGVSSHVFDYDDTHLKTIIHPAGPVASAILALSQRRRLSGADFLTALILGMECELRIGNAVYPSHYDLGWHITGTCGPFGAAAACGKVLGLDELRMGHALGIAASQPVGLKIQFGSMTKSLHPGRAAQNGMLAALLAEKGFTADLSALEGRDGWAQAASRQHDWREVTEELGNRFESALNTYKPFACGIVTHPAIDAALQLRSSGRLRIEQVSAIELRANPLVLKLTGKTEPSSGLEGKFSIYHCIAAALVYGAAGEKQFSDAAVIDPRVVNLRRLTRVQVDPSINPEQAELRIMQRASPPLTKRIEHALGSLERPMSDHDLELKFADLCDGVLPTTQAAHLRDLCWNLERLNLAEEIANAASAA